MLSYLIDRSWLATDNTAADKTSPAPNWRFPREDTVMNKDQVKGRIEEAKGSIKETVGKVVGSTKLKTEGAVEKAAGKTEATYGDAKDKVKTQVNKG